MRVTHIYHSGFAVELSACTLLFDWYTGELPQLRHGLPLVVFVSHEHHDHYGQCIWPLREQFPNVSYVLDKDVAANAPTDARVTAVEPHMAYELQLPAASGPDPTTLRVQTLESNDEGVAFLVRACGTTIYFPVDLAFVPIDPRLEDPTAGIAAFMDVVGTHALFPMHYWGRAEEARALMADPRLAPYAGITHFEDVCELPDPPKPTA